MIVLPKYPSQVIARFLKPLCQPYQELATAFNNSTCEDVRTVINKHSDTFVRDQTMGLVKIVSSFFFCFSKISPINKIYQVSYSLYKKNIQRLTKTFLTLSLADVAHRVQLPSALDAETYILNMVSAFLFSKLNSFLKYFLLKKY